MNMASKLLIVVAFLNALLMGGVSAFWRMECRGQLALARIDPMMAKGETSEHAHSIFGSDGFSETVTFNDLRDGNCTSCAVTEDMSAYWTPSLYFQHANGTYQAVVQVGGMLAYYLPRDPLNNVKGFPAGFRMIAGNSLRRNYTVGNPEQPDPEQSIWSELNQTTQNDLEQRAIGFNCLNYAKTAEASLWRHYMPDKSYLDANCVDGIRLELAFPSCWNGKDVDTDDHKSHMAYPDLVQNGNCPDGFETRLVTLFYESIFDTYEFKDSEGEFVLANGDVTGYGYHGDFIMGWDETFLQQAVDTCTNESGMIQDCPLFTIQDEATQNTCKITLPSALAKENVLGTAETLTALPGNVKIQYGPEQATVDTDGGLIDTLTSILGGGASSTSMSSYVAPTLSYTPGQSSSQSGGGIDVITPSSTSTSTTTSTTPVQSSFYAASKPSQTAGFEAESVSSSVTSAADPNITYMPVSTEYMTDGTHVTQVVWVEAVQYVTEDTTTTVTMTAPFARKKARRNHILAHRQHGHGHGHGHRV